MRRHNRYPGRGTGTGFSIFIFVIILAVAVGYAGTKYIIFPYLLVGNQAKASSGNEVATNTAVDVSTSAPSIIIDQQNLKKSTAETTSNQVVSNPIIQTSGNGNGPFSVQYGSFITKDGAEIFSRDLSGKGIYSYVYQSDGSYKVLGLPYSTENKAKEALAVVSSVVPDVFVVNLSTLIH